MPSHNIIGFDARPALATYSGIGHYVRQLFPAMFRLNSSVEWLAFAPPQAHLQLGPHWGRASVSLKTHTSGLRGWMKRFSNTLDIFHGTNFRASNVGQKKTVLTIHDLWLDRNPKFSKKLFGQRVSSWKTRRGAVRAEKIITVSKFSKQEIHEIFAIPLEKIAVIYHGCSSDMFPDHDERKWCDVRERLGLSTRPFILFVGGAEPRKNHRVLFEAFSRAPELTQDFSLIAIGNESVKSWSLHQTANDLKIANVVICPGFLSTADLRIMYSKATAFVFPSRYEGFGLPLLEAMACGTPIITGDNTALREVAGNAALYINVQDPEHLRNVLRKLLNDSMLQEQLRYKGVERVKQFTWERAARETLAVYHEIC